jgi:predicted metal-binding protein
MDASFGVILNRLEKIALECGFTRTGRLNPAAMKVRREVREACAADKCRAYGKSWSCPPACGNLTTGGSLTVTDNLEECEKRLTRFRAGLILQTTGKLEDAFDIESMSLIGENHNAHLFDFQEKLVSVFPEAGSWLLLGSGCCKICKQCSYPQSPCNYPEKMIVPVEAMGIVVSDLCAANNILYYYGPGTLTYVGCVLIRN